LSIRWFFGLFLLSGFCSLVYQVVWLRLAMAGFGVTAAMISIVVSVFMAGLAVGSLLAGRLARSRAASAEFPLRLYALAELIIALSGDAVPRGLDLGHALLSRVGQDLAWGSVGHYLVAAACVALVMLPFCVCMGATIPLAMWAIRRNLPDESRRSFSYLYLANVLGAGLGTLASAFVLIELFGFRGTALIAASLNALLAATALALSLVRVGGGSLPDVGAGHAPSAESANSIPWLLFGTGLASMGLEVVWVRQFTPYLGTVVYAFALILALYLAATFAGSAVYRLRKERGSLAAPVLAWPLLGALGLLCLAASDPRLPLPPGLVSGALRVAIGVGPLCATLGYLTPHLVDRRSGGDADRAGSAYAVNVLGCIVGPLVAGFALLPRLCERGSVVALAIPLFACAVAGARLDGTGSSRPRRLAWATALALGAAVLAFSRDFAAQIAKREARSDSAATVIAAGEGMDKVLLVNGVGMTSLTPITKMMAHLPLALLQEPPRKGLVICFGMGTSFRSFLSWEVDTTAVELIPSVPELFSYFHPDGPALLGSPSARIVIDDGRRFLERTSERYDVITIDPPPPVEAAGSSLLYSREFYDVARRRMSEGGILQQWLPYADGVVVASFTRALLESFPHVSVFRGMEGVGLHYLASDSPLPERSAQELARRLSPSAVRDLVEWGPASSAEGQFALVLDRPVPVAALLAMGPGIPALRDDHPYNEYFLLRTLARRR
jgi:spermidine synthase/MFS family permease